MASAELTVLTAFAQRPAAKVSTTPSAPAWQRGFAAIVAVILPTSAPAQVPPVGAGGDAPLRIERCVVTSRSQLLDPLNSLRIDFVSGLDVRFVNLRHATATAVRFSFRYQGESLSLTDRGTFAGGFPIERLYPAFAGQLSGGDAAGCSVSHVTYADGTSWPAGPS